MSDASYQHWLEQIERIVLIKNPHWRFQNEIIGAACDLKTCGHADVEKRARQLVRRLGP